jgi:hypothetical protein
MRNKFIRIKPTLLVLSYKFYSKEYKMMVELWYGETKDEYFIIEMANDKRFGCVVVGAISEREIDVRAGKIEIFKADKECTIEDISNYFKWNLKKTKFDDSFLRTDNTV